MSTRSAIIEKTDSEYRGVYCHSDGYPEGVGQTLLDHYTDPQKIHRLIDLGELSVLGERVEPIGAHSFGKPEEGTTVAYHRDRGEVQRGPKLGVTVADVAKQIGHNGYVYVWEDGAWTCNGQPLAEAIEAETQPS